MEKFVFVFVFVFVAIVAGCKQQSPDAEVPVVPESSQEPVQAVSVAKVARAGTGNSIGADGLVHDVTSEFDAGDNIYLSLKLDGSGEAEVTARIVKSDKDVDAILTKSESFSLDGSKVVTLLVREPATVVPAGDYRLMVVLNGVPSWGLPVTMKN